jgi:hypothetical protein
LRCVIVFEDRVVMVIHGGDAMLSHRIFLG